MTARTLLALAFCMGSAATATATETTIKNDSLTDFGNAAIVWGFVTGEMAASWLTSPCDGNLVAVQIFWRSPSGTSADTIEDSINIYRSGSFPVPGELAQTIGGPVLHDNALNEWRYLDDQGTLPLVVPVSSGETVVVALAFAAEPQPNVDPSVVRDTDGNTTHRNAIYANIGGSTFQWFDSASFGVAGDWVIRAVVDCAAVSTDADVSVSMSASPTAYIAGSPLQYTIVVANAGPAASPSTTLVDTFPAAYQSPSWTCTPGGGATCPAGSSGNIIGSASLPAGSQLTFVVDGTVATGTTGTLGNSMTAVVNAPATDPVSTNNTATLDIEPAVDDTIFEDGFEPSSIVRVPALAPTPAASGGERPPQ